MGYYFDVRHERDHIDVSMVEDLQQEFGTVILWFRFSGESAEQTHPIYGESYPGGGLDWDAPFLVPVISAVTYEGQEQNENGFYTTDRIHVAMNAEQVRRAGLVDLERGRDTLRDRIVYRGVVYDVQAIQSWGRVQRGDVVIGLDGVEVDPDELVNSERFMQYAD